MFTVKLATGEGFPVTVAEQRRVSWEGRNGLRTLQLECAPAGHEMEWYAEQLEAKGALDVVEITSGDGPGLHLEGYTQIEDISLRLLETGDPQLSITLSKPKPRQKED